MRFAILSALCFAFVFIRANAASVDAESMHPQELYGETGKCQLVASDYAQTYADYVKIDGKLKNCFVDGEARRVSGGIRLYVSNFEGDISIGDTIEFTAKIKRPKSFLNEGSYSPSEKLFTKGISATASAESIKIVKPTESPIYKFAGIARSKVIRALPLTPPDESAVVAAVSVNVREWADPELSRVFGVAGTAHILSISGLHVGLLAGFIFIFIRYLLSSFPRIFLKIPRTILSLILSVPVVWTYVFVSGLPASAVRSAIMFTVFALARSLNKKVDATSALSLAVVFMLCISPLSILDISFQLSCLAVLGIICVGLPAMEFFVSGCEGDEGVFCKIKRMFIGSSFMSLASVLFTLPVAAATFAYVPTLGLLTNLLCIPIAGFFMMPSVFVGMLLSLFSQTAGQTSFIIAEIPASVIVWASRFVEKLSLSSINWSPSNLELIVFYFILITILFTEGVSRRLIIFLFGAMLIFFLGTLYSVNSSFGRLAYYQFDVGQGDAALVVFPNGKKMLIDGGGIKRSFDVGQMVVAPALIHLGISTIDYILISHPHFDHYGGLSYIVQKFAPTEIFYRSAVYKNADIEEFEKLLSEARADGVVINELRNGDGFEEGGANAKFLYSPCELDCDANAASIVTLINYGASKIVSVGDLSRAGEFALSEVSSDVDILKVAHHGSRDASSQEILKVLRPKISLISAGRNNQFKFPHAETLGRLRQVNSEIKSTIESGMMKFVFDKRGIVD